MTDYEISGLTALSSPAAGDLLVIVDVSDTSTPPAGAAGSDKKITFADLTAGLLPLTGGTLTGNLVIQVTGTYASMTFTADGDGAQYSNFQLADDVYPLDAAGHYWAFSHRESAHILLLYNYNGAAYTSVLAMGENGEIVTVGNSQLDDGSGNMIITGVSSLNGGTDTSSTATASSPSFTTATAQQLSGTQDVNLSIAVNTGSTFTIAYGPTSTPAITLVNNKALTAGQVIGPFRVPKGWYVEITGTIADLTITQVTC